MLFINLVMFESACDFAARIFRDSLFLGNFEIQKRHIRATFISDNFIYWSLLIYSSKMPAHQNIYNCLKMFTTLLKREVVATCGGDFGALCFSQKTFYT
jgi:hypothetical protein